MSVAWYAAYGSNTDETRFRHYLAGCQQPAEPADSRPYLLDLPLYFAGTTSRRWGDGGVAFTSTERDSTPSTLARAWLLPVERIAEIGAQENGLPIEQAHLDLDAVRAAGVHRAHAGRWYDGWVDCGELDDLPVVTITATEPRTPRNAPSRAYAEVVARGLRLTHGMTREDVAIYLADRTNLPVATLMEWQREGEG
ncbi:MAG TPA: hypothetical protein VFU93_14620 [Acidimicrobiales bacterium]|nr:hypothetical protein [Acidimicrobiales bacterium]